MHYRSFAEAVQDDKRSGSVIEDNKIQMLKNIFTPHLKHFDRKIRGKWYIMRSKNVKRPTRKLIGAGFKKIIYWAGTITISLIIGFSLQIVLAAWNAPPSAPPAGNLPYPLNTSANNQIKAGALGIGGLFQTDGNTYLATSTGNVGIGTTTPPEKLTLEGGNFLQTAGNPKMPIITLPLGDNPRGIYVLGKYAYIVGVNNSSLNIVDISNPQQPSVIKKYINPILGGAQSVYISGQYAYIAAGSLNTLAKIDISNPQNPQLAGWLTDETNMRGPASVYVSGKYAYVAAEDSDSLAVIDISSSTPVYVNSVSNSFLDGARSVYVSGNYAYVAARNPGSAYGSITVINISNPAAPTFAGAVSDLLFHRCYSVYVSGKYAYLVGNRLDLETDQAGSFAVIDISNPTNPQIKSIIEDVSYLSGPTSVYVSGKYAYVSNNYGWDPDSQGSLSIIDISNPNNPQLVSLIESDTLWGASAIYVSGKYAYVAASESFKLAVINISGIDAPTASIGNISASQINVSDNMDIGNNLYIRNGLNVGPGGIKSDGVIQATSTESVSSLILRGVSAPPAVCNSGNKGIIYYESNLNIYCYCDGSSWQKLNSPGGACP